MRGLRSDLVAVLRLVPFAALGGLMAFLAWNVLISPVPHSPAAEASPTEAAIPSAPACPSGVVHGVETGSGLPYVATVHVSDGVNLRAGPSITADRITALVQGTRLTVDGRLQQPDGSTWDHVRLGDDRAGWVDEQYVVSYPVDPSTQAGITLWLPSGYEFVPIGAATAHVRWRPDPSTLLMLVQSSAIRGDAPVPPAPAGYPARSQWLPDHQEDVLVGDWHAQDAINRVLTCPALLVHEVSVTSLTRHYDFLFFTDPTTAPVVREVLTSASIA